jgi:predicted RNA-binding protein YlxR (DUF448 family)
MEKSQPIRMCIACRDRYPQKTLLRLQQIQREIVTYRGSGRSFYVCKVCIDDEKRLQGLAKRLKQEYGAFKAFCKCEFT